MDSDKEVVVYPDYKDQTRCAPRRLPLQPQQHAVDEVQETIPRNETASPSFRSNTLAEIPLVFAESTRKPKLVQMRGGMKQESSALLTIRCSAQLQYKKLLLISSVLVLLLVCSLLGVYLLRSSRTETGNDTSHTKNGLETSSATPTWILTFSPTLSPTISPTNSPSRSREVSTFKPTVFNAPTLEPSKRIASSAVPKSLVSEALFAIVSCYEPATLFNSTVTVDLPGSKVVLVLPSYEKVNWWVNATLGTNVSAILVSSYYSSTLLTDTTAEVFFLDDLSYALQSESVNFESLLITLNTMFPWVDHADTFQGHYELPLSVLVDSVSDPPPPELTLKGPQPNPVQESDNFEFQLLTNKFNVVSWTLNGPSATTSNSVNYYTGPAAFANNTIYVFDDDQLRIVDRITKDERIAAAMPITFPRVSWPDSLVIDTKRQILSLVAQRHVYRYDLHGQAWLDVVSLDRLDISSVIYDELSDRYIGLRSWTSVVLVFVSSDWQLQGTSSNLQSRMKGFGRLGNGPEPQLLLAIQEEQVALIHVGGGIFSLFSTRPITRNVWYYNLASDEVVFTYQG